MKIKLCKVNKNAFTLNLFEHGLCIRFPFLDQFQTVPTKTVSPNCVALLSVVLCFVFSSFTYFLLFYWRISFFSISFFRFVSFPFLSFLLFLVWSLSSSLLHLEVLRCAIFSFIFSLKKFIKVIFVITKIWAHFVTQTFYIDLLSVRNVMLFKNVKSLFLILNYFSAFKSLCIHAGL